MDSDSSFSMAGDVKKVVQETPNKTQRKRKANACYFCRNPPKKFVKISQHLISQHSQEKEVQEILKHKGLTERRKEFAKLIGRANERYNKSLKRRKGHVPEEFILKYHKKEEAVKLTEKEIFPCSHCGHMYHADSLHRHKCVQDYKGTSSYAPIKNKSYYQWKKATEVSQVMEEVLSSLRNDEIGDIIKSDETILKYGEQQINAYNGIELPNKKEKLDQIRQSLRGVARYLKEFRCVCKNNNLSIKETFFTENLCYVEAVGVEYGQNYSKPNALNLLHNTLTNILEMIAASTISTEDFHFWGMLKHHFAFKWLKTITPKVKNARLQKNLEKKAEIPTTDDIKILNSHIKNQIDTLLKMDITTYSEYLNFCRYTYARITCFNYRRGGEVARMTVSQYNNREENISKADNNSFNTIEKEAVKNMTVITLKGKSSQNEVVLAILPIDCVNAINKILVIRRQFKALERNNYVFGTSGGLCHHISGYSSLRYVVKESGLQYPTRFTSSKLRKYISTEMLWLNISDTQRKLLASHLGHLVSTHENVYMEHVRSGKGKFDKIPAMLLNFEAGLATKPLDDVTDTDALNYIQNSSSTIDNNTLMVQKKQKQKFKSMKRVKVMKKLNQQIESSDESDCSYNSDSSTDYDESEGSLVTETTLENSIPNDNADINNNDNLNENQNINIETNKQHVDTSRVHWTEEMITFLKVEFNNVIIGKTSATKEKILEFQRKIKTKYDLNLSEAKIRSAISNLKLSKRK